MARLIQHSFSSIWQSAGGRGARSAAQAGRQGQQLKIKFWSLARLVVTATRVHFTATRKEQGQIWVDEVGEADTTCLG